MATLRSWERTVIVAKSSDYARAECSTKAFRWVDDLELHLRVSNSKDGHSCIAIRSASRQGWWDFGENRRRVEVLRAQLLARGVLAMPSHPKNFDMNELPVLAAMFSSIVGYAMVLPLLPMLLDAESLGATRYGAVNSLGNFVALVAATGLGWLSDLHGRRPAVLVCAVVGAAGTVLIGSRLLLPVGAAGIGQVLAVLGLILRRVDRNSAGAILQAVGVDTTAEQFRSAYMGRLNMAMSLGFTAGSSLGGVVTQYFGHRVTLSAALLCGALYVLMAFVSIPGIPSSTKTSAAAAMGHSAATTKGDHVFRGSNLTAPSTGEQEHGKFPLQSMLANKRVMALLLCKACVSLAFFVLTGTFDLFLTERFQMDPASFGFFLSFIGLCFAFVNGAWAELRMSLKTNQLAQIAHSLTSQSP